MTSLVSELSRLLMASSSKPTVSSSSEEDVARGIGVQPYRSEPRKRSNNGDEESDASELTLQYKYENCGRFAPWTFRRAQ